MGVIPIGISRVSNALLLDRSMLSVQNQQLLIANYEQQIITQQRYQYGSDAPSDASTSLSIQMQMERKAQNAKNLLATQSYLTASDSTLAQINGQLTEARAMGLEGINTTTSTTQRQALAQSLLQSTQTIFNFANYQFRDRYLFSGATTDTKAFEWGTDSYSVVYKGSTNNLFSWSDTDLLSQTNANGANVFGAVSKAVKGKTDLNPAMSGTTLLSSLNGGQGVQPGSIRITYSGPDGTRESVVDLSKAVTVDDVRSLIAKNAPAGTTVKLGITDDALSVELTSENPGGSITITEVGSTLTAHNLGIYTKTPITTSKSFLGTDLDPAVTRTTSLDSLLGSPATTVLRFPGYNNDLVIQANYNGETYTDSDGNVWPLNDVKIAFQSNAQTAPGSETASFDPASKTITVQIHPDNSTASNIATAINNAAAAGTIPPLSASIDLLDQVPPGSKAGNGPITLLPGAVVVLGTTAGGNGQSFDKTGIQLVNGGSTFSIDFSDCKTVDDLLNVLNDPKYGLYADINASKTGINVCSRVSGTDFMIGENGGSTATQLGIRTLNEGTYLSELDFNRGVMDYEGPGTNASALYESTTANSGLRLTAIAEGPDWNDYDLIFVPTSDPEGKVTVQWDQEQKTITVGVNSGVTQACEVVTAFAEQAGPNQAFTLVLDDSLGTNTGTGVVYTGQTTTAGGADGGIDFMITRNDGTVLEIDINGCKTIGDVLAAINNHPLNKDGLLTAGLSKSGNGIELSDHSIGAYTTKIERAKLSTAAIDLGLIPKGEEYQYANSGGSKASANIDSGNANSDLLVVGGQNGAYANGVKVEFVDMNAAGGSGQPGFSWDAQSQTLRFEIDPGTTTAQDIIRLYQDNASSTLRGMFDFQNGVNADGTTSDGTGLVALFPRPVDPTDPTAGTVPAPEMTGGADNKLTGTDPNPLETESIFTALIRMEQAMQNDDVREIERATNLMEQAVKTMAAARAEIGVRQNALDSVQFRLENESVELTQALNDSIGIDLSAAIMQYSSAMLAYEATLQVTSRMFQMNLMNYI